MKTRLLILAGIGLALCTGCVTRNVKVATRRSTAVLESKGAEGDKLSAACAVEMGQVCLELGADKIPAEEIVLTPEAALAGAAAIQEDLAFREKVLGFFGNLGKSLAGNWPWVGTAFGMITALVAAIRGLVKAKGAVTASVALFQDIKTKLGDGVSLQDFKDIMESAKKNGSPIEAGARELYDAYKSWLAAAKRNGEAE